MVAATRICFSFFLPHFSDLNEAHHHPHNLGAYWVNLARRGAFLASLSK
jgi:hypothetical protein